VLLREQCAVRLRRCEPPVGRRAANLNAAVLLETALAPDEFRRQVIVPIEQQLGRKRDPANKNAPRTIDLDIALWDEGSFDFGEKPWHVPDANITRFIHVARPLADLAPGYVHPEDGRTLAEIAAALPAEGITRRSDLAL
jgi:2-amino-4-hydroxy-6-hydroxymethyldihydropteridine diphosphokinase